MERRRLLIASAVAVVLAAGGVPAAAGMFRVTTNPYAQSDNISAAIVSEFGADYRLADWSDIVALRNSDPDGFSSLVQAIPYQAWVSYSGSQFYSSDRRYFANVSDHNTPSGFLVHAHIDNHLLDLGSWWGTNYALAYTAVPEPSSLLALTGGLGCLLPLIRRRR